MRRYQGSPQFCVRFWGDSPGSILKRPEWQSSSPPGILAKERIYSNYSSD